jgi:hypothetical protein
MRTAILADKLLKQRERQMDVGTIVNLEFIKSIIFILLIDYYIRFSAVLLFSGIC